MDNHTDNDDDNHDDKPNYKPDNANDSVKTKTISWQYRICWFLSLITLVVIVYFLCVALGLTSMSIATLYGYNISTGCLNNDTSTSYMNRYICYDQNTSTHYNSIECSIRDDRRIWGGCFITGMLIFIGISFLVFIGFVVFICHTECRKFKKEDTHDQNKNISNISTIHDSDSMSEIELEQITINTSNNDVVVRLDNTIDMPSKISAKTVLTTPTTKIVTAKIVPTETISADNYDDTAGLDGGSDSSVQKSN